MTKANRFGSAISLVALSATIAACAAPQVQTSGLGGRTGDDIGLATRAALALHNKDVPNAILLAERAVAKTPDDAGFRTLLGNAYFAGGRFRSAESAYKDALALYANQPQAVLKLVLAQIAQGKTFAAFNTLQAGRTVLPAADFGLAMALAGHPDDAVEVLQTAARETGAGARVRQNLALAYGLTGDWAQARTVAAQDVPGNLLDARIQQWMRLAKPVSAADQVASLVGVVPAVGDTGQPVRLALASTDGRFAEAVSVPASPRSAARAAPSAIAAVAPVAPVQDQPRAVPQQVMAEASPPPPPPPFPQFAEAVPPLPKAPMSRASMARTSTPRAAMARPAAAAQLTPVTTALLAAAAHVRSAFNAVLPQSAPALVAKRSKPVARVQQASVRRGNSTSVVQLGAYASSARVAGAWTDAARKYAALRLYVPVSARFDSSRGTVYRLSVKGFANADEAKTLCGALHRSGASCFVRSVAGDAPVQYAER
ncbi:MAG: tetratricopeptide repeat protein [Sphingomicrobium sp.]